MQPLVVDVEKVLQFKMWKHYCPIEETDMEVGKGEECNWCGAIEDNDWDTSENGFKKLSFKHLRNNVIPQILGLYTNENTEIDIDQIQDRKKFHHLPTLIGICLHLSHSTTQDNDLHLSTNSTRSGLMLHCKQILDEMNSE